MGIFDKFDKYELFAVYVPTLSKYLVETLYFGRNREKFPTTKYLLHGDSFGNEIVADKIRSFVKKQYDITRNVG